MTTTSRVREAVWSFGWVAFLATFMGCHATTLSHPPAAGTDAAGPQDEPLACGNSPCESVTWPRLVVALSDLRPRGDGGIPTAEQVTTSAYYDGAERPPGTSGGCALGFDVIRCSDSFFGRPGLTSMTLHVQLGGQTGQSKTVALKPFNYCGNDLAYVAVTVASDGSVSIGDPTYVSPCRAL